METLKFLKTECGVEVLLNVLHFTSADSIYLKKVPFNTDFFEIVFYKKAKGKLLLNDHQIEMTANSVVFLSPYQKRQWHFDEGEQDFTILLFQEDFLNDFFADKLFAYRLLCFYQLDYPLKMEVGKKRYKASARF
ncbi:cupin domain-containing protein [Pontibacter beigongshangensis]|uniref:hypothetical protein n=1 Tax=Pontibacter beigongshangensis TaxID=2574733 RepID=UPI0019D4FC50|nr:hypothetical protein [Pontibacter beigongshangensis]